MKVIHREPARIVIQGTVTVDDIIEKASDTDHFIADLLSEIAAMAGVAPSLIHKIVQETDNSYYEFIADFCETLAWYLREAERRRAYIEAKQSVQTK